jgi:quercetin dioxygenase-like cupin family protein
MKTLLLLGVSLALASSGAGAQINANDLEWGPPPAGLPDGALLAVLSGNPEQPGMFTVRLRLPPGYKVMPHRHPAFEMVTVIGGDLSFGMGRKFNEKKATSLARGGFVIAQPNMDHYVSTKEGTTVQITGVGPFQITYVNPRDDPRRQRKK